MRIALALLAAALVAASSAAAAEVRVMSAGAVEPGLEAAARLFRERTGNAVTIRYGTGPQLQARLAGGESADLLIAPRAVMQTAQAAAKVTGEPVVVGRVGIGVAVRKGAPRPDISSVAALTEALRAANIDTPVLAAGGIVTGAQMAAAMAMGAAGAWCGSVWLTTPESETSPVIKAKLLAASSRDTVRSRSRTGKPSRQLRSPWTDAWETDDAPSPLPMPMIRPGPVSSNFTALPATGTTRPCASTIETATTDTSSPSAEIVARSGARRTDAGTPVVSTFVSATSFPRLNPFADKVPGA